jgi:hypothetical protein
MKIHFKCNDGVTSCTRRSIHQESSMKRYIAGGPPIEQRSQFRNFELVEVCDPHYARHLEFAWTSMVLACQIGCNHLRCQEAYK